VPSVWEQGFQRTLSSCSPRPHRGATDDAGGGDAGGAADHRSE
jgi:hypothetical protein